MFTQCPWCETVYPLSPRLLAQARGRIRCGACEREFDALDRLGEHPEFGAVAHAGDGTPPELLPVLGPEQLDLFGAPPSAGYVPGFVRPAGPDGGSRSRRPWVLAATVLSATLLLQTVLAQRETLAADPRWRPLVAALCGGFGCTLPPWREPETLQLLARDVGPHPSVPDALLITLALRNASGWPQAWPQLEVALSDLDGRTLAFRRFDADSYLGANLPGPALLPGETVVARLEVRDPDKAAVAFAFEFR